MRFNILWLHDRLEWYILCHSSDEEFDDYLEEYNIGFEDRTNINITNSVIKSVIKHARKIRIKNMHVA